MSDRLTSPQQLAAYQKKLQAGHDPAQPCVTVCSGTGCRANRGLEVAVALRKACQEKQVGDKVRVRITGCLGFCEKGPIVTVRPQGLFYTMVKPADAQEIVEKTLLRGEEVQRLFVKDVKTGQPIRTKGEIPFYKNQRPLIFGTNFELDPQSIDDYIRLGGYSALVKALSAMQPNEIIEEVIKSGLRGRGGAGFPAGVKWAAAAAAQGNTKYIICNADEGDPGAYANRSLLEGNPHGVVEGMIIGAYAVGACEGYVYVRTEYPLAVGLVTKAVQDARERGLLGRNILGTGFNFDIRIDRGGGAFVCGEETGLMASIEGGVGEPRPRYVYPVERGLWSMPTVINNVETWANVPHITLNGAGWLSSLGTETSKGTKIFSLVGKVNNTGLVEVPMGATLRQIIYEIGGGIKEGKKFKGVQTGGPSGGVLGERHLDLPIDYDQLVAVGSMMGSGGMIVMDEDNCMVDFARFFLAFLEDESCGKCTPCREGIAQMRQILEDICAGRATPDDVQLLRELAEVVRDASLCALGGTAPNPVLTTLSYFPEEYEAHVRDRKCPAGTCRALVTYAIAATKCTGCTLCARNCPNEAIRGEKKLAHEIAQEKCTKCGICYEVCKFDAVKRN